MKLSKLAQVLFATAGVVITGPTIAQTPVTVADLVQFAKIGDPNALNDDEQYEKDLPGLFSPDGGHVAVIVRRGNVTKGSNDGTLLVYRTADLFHDAKPITLAEFSSTTNGQPIAFLRWLDDNETIFFSASQEDKAPQIYSANIKSRKIEQVTHETDTISAFDLNPSGSKLIVSAIPTLKPPATDPECKRRGCLIGGGTIWDAEFGRSIGTNPLTIRDLRNGSIKSVQTTEKADSTVNFCFDPLPRVSSGISPDGRFLTRTCEHNGPVKSWWHSYTASSRLRDCQTNLKRGCWRRVELIDLESGARSFLSDAPSVYGSPAPLWIDGGRYLIIPEAVEPLEGVDAAERAARVKSLAILLVDPLNGRTTRIGRLDPGTANVTEATWDAETEVLLLKPVNEDRSPLPTITYKRNGGKWTAIAAQSGQQASIKAGLRLAIRQSLNDRPVLVAVNERTGQTKTVLDPDPWLADRVLGKVELFKVTSGGKLWEGGLYYPPDYKPGTRYPLVIQTHGFDDKIFSMDGYSRNYAGRALASEGMMVLSLEENYRGAASSPAEYPTVQAGWEATIDELDKRGLIDPARVGIYNKLDRAMAEDEPSARLKEIDAARAEAAELLEIFSALLRISEVEGLAERPPRSELDLSTLVEQMAETYRPDMEATGHRLWSDIAMGITIAGDRRLLSQALANLLDNSIRHTPPGTAVSLSLRAQGESARLQIVDNGPGAPGDPNRLLQRFARSEAARSTPGHGLGLALVAAITRAHGGSIEIVNDDGFVVTIALPLG